jgi:hypothetical protein
MPVSPTTMIPTAGMIITTMPILSPTWVVSVEEYATLVIPITGYPNPELSIPIKRFSIDHSIGGITYFAFSIGILKHNATLTISIFRTKEHAP